MNSYKRLGCIALFLIILSTLFGGVDTKQSKAQVDVTNPNFAPELPKIKDLRIPGKIAFVHESGGKIVLYVAQADGTVVSQVDFSFLDTSSEKSFSQLVLSPDGTKLAYFMDGGAGITIVDLDGTKPVKTTYFPPEQFSGVPDYFVDKSTLRLASNYIASGDYWLLDLNTKMSRPIKADGQPCKCILNYSPDGMKAFSVVENEIRFVSTEGKIADTLTTDSLPLQVSWSPDSRLVAYGTINSISIYNISTRTTRQVIPKRTSLDRFVWTPDSLHLAHMKFVHSTKPQDRTLFVLDVMSGEDRELVNSPSYLIAWSK